VNGSAAIQEVNSALEAFFVALENQDETTIRDLWHPDAALFINGTELAVRPMSFLLEVAEQMRFELAAIKHIDVHEVIATARADYRLSVGIHSGFFNLVKTNGQWQIANWIDYGVEEG
jgi:hypothetical protein